MRGSRLAPPWTGDQKGVESALSSLIVMQAEIPESWEIFAPEIGAIIVATAREYGQTVAEIRKRGAGNDARTMVVYLSRELGGHPQAEIGKAVGLEKTSSVSSAYLRMKAMMVQDRRVARRAAKIKEALLKSKKADPTPKRMRL